MNREELSARIDAFFDSWLAPWDKDDNEDAKQAATLEDKVYDLRELAKDLEDDVPEELRRLLELAEDIGEPEQDTTDIHANWLEQRLTSCADTFRRSLAQIHECSGTDGFEYNNVGLIAHYYEQLRDMHKTIDEMINTARMFGYYVTWSNGNYTGTPHVEKA